MSKAWVHSHSSLELYALCPKKFYHEKILKDVPFVESGAVTWGNDVHRELERAIKERQPLGKRFEMYQKIVDKVTTSRAISHTEIKLAVNKEFHATDFFAPDAYVRGIADLVLDYGDKLAALDWKTGKKKAGSRQLTLMALLLFALFPNVQEIYTAFVWLQNGTLTSEVYRRGQIQELWDLFLQPMKELEWSIANDVWHPRENYLCKNWCNVYSCMFCGKKK